MIRKRIGVALLVIGALSAIVAGSASAAATTTAAEVYTGASPGTTLMTTETITGAVESSTTVVMKSKVGTSLTPVEMTASGGSCSGCTIENKEITGKAGKVAFGTGKIILTGVTVNTPLHCAVSGGSITSKPINGHGDFMNGTGAVVQVLPASGTSFAAVELINSGGTCAVAGLYNVTGSLFCEWNWSTGTFFTTHTCRFSPAINTSNGGGLTVGTQVMELTGNGVAALGSGKEWSIKWVGRGSLSGQGTEGSANPAGPDADRQHLVPKVDR